MSRRRDEEPDLFPVATPPALDRPVETLRIRMAISQALKECPESAAVIAARISELTGRELTVAALYSYTAPGNEGHDISLVRFVAFVRATGAWWLWRLLLAPDGLSVFQGSEARIAEISQLERERERINGQLRKLKGRR